MQLIRVIVGNLQTNCYILIKDNKAIIIDPGDEPERIEKELGNNKLVGILLTHNHFDHVGALLYFEEKYNLKHNDKIDDFDYEVIKTPGHAKECLTFYFPKEKIMFVGDFIFQNSIGRMDLPGGSISDMMESLNMISKYPGDITLFPGHGPCTILGEEKENFKYYF